MSFDGLGLSPELLRAVADEGYTEPTPVQSAAIPAILAGRDVHAGAQTGTGKTAAFVLPIIQTLHETRRDPGAARHTIRVLAVVPTRELAIQVEESFRTYGKHRPIRSATIYGGVGIGPQITKLRAGPEVVVATPGRLLDHVGQRTINLSTVEVLVLDEADRLLDMGFIRDIRKIIDLLPRRRQNLMFSATFSDDVRLLADGILDDPARIQVTPRNTTAELIDQLVIPVDRERKRDLVRELVALGRVKQALVFTRTKHGANRLAEQLAKDGIRAAAIHGNKSQNQRVKALEDFKAGRVDLLVATDVAARGIDIEQLPHVINFEMPMVPEDYVHRIGRTGRAGTGGQAISLVCVDERPLLQDIQQLLRRAIPTETIAGFEPDRSIRAEPIRLRSTPAERAEQNARRAAAGGGGRSGGGRGRPGAGRPGAGRTSAGGAYGSGAPRHAAPDRRGDDAFVAGSYRGDGTGYGSGRGPSDAGRGAPAARGESPSRDGYLGGTPAGGGFGGGHASGSAARGASPSRGGSGPRRSGRGRPPGSPGVGFGNQVSQGRAPGGERQGHGRPAQGRPSGGTGGGRPASGSGYAGHADGRPANGHAPQRAMPGERLKRLG
ncbi:MAG: DEAD/DEAH box helicase [Candidatus Limnocylindrales bacterium]